MKLVRFLAKSFHGGRLIDPGEEVLVADDVTIGAHMVDVAAESAARNRGEELPVVEMPRRPDAVFRADLADGAAMVIAPPVASVAPVEPVEPVEPVAPVESTEDPAPSGDASAAS